MLKVSFIGRLGADAEVKTSQSGNQFLTMNVAVDNYHKGERNTIWVRVATLGDRNVKMKDYLTKGKLVDVNGVLQVSTYVNKNGETAISYDVNADRIDFVNVGGSGSTQTNETVAESAQDTGTFKPQQTAAPQPSVAVAASESNDVDDLPF